MQNAGLKDSKHVSVEEKLLIFIYIYQVKGYQIAQLQEQFNRCDQIVS
jgi:hypothetical protein